jgi:DNA end-binding protein Ku
LIKAKKAGKKPPVVSAAEPPSNVVNLFDALKKSLASESGKIAAKGKSSAAGEKTVKKASAGRRR